MWGGGAGRLACSPASVGRGGWCVMIILVLFGMGAAARRWPHAPGDLSADACGCCWVRGRQVFMSGAEAGGLAPAPEPGS